MRRNSLRHYPPGFKPFYPFFMLVFTFLCRAYGSGKEDNPPCDVPGFENTRMKLLRHVSFVDCPVIIYFSYLNSTLLRLEKISVSWLGSIKFLC